jgi:hypothetical protein
MKRARPMGAFLFGHGGETRAGIRQAVSMRQCRVCWPTRARKRAIRRNSDDVQYGESPGRWSAAAVLEVVTSAWRSPLALNGGVFRCLGPGSVGRCAF